MKSVFNNYKKFECLENNKKIKNIKVLELIPLFESFIENIRESVDPIVNEKNAYFIMNIFINSTNNLQDFEQEELKLIFLLTKKILFDKREIDIDYEKVNHVKKILIENMLTFSLSETIDFLDYFLIINYCKSSIYNSELRDHLIRYAADEMIRIRKIPELFDYLDEQNATVYPKEIDPYKNYFDKNPYPRYADEYSEEIDPYAEYIEGIDPHADIEGINPCTDK